MAIDDVSRDLDGGGPYCSAPRSGCPAKVGRRSEERPTLPSGGGNGVGAIRQRDSIRVASLSLPRSSLGETPSDAKVDRIGVVAGLCARRTKRSR
ncbi:hypothetical protein U1Q18_039193 [Sarracenia purpurea var. burkii]